MNLTVTELKHLKALLSELSPQKSITARRIPLTIAEKKSTFEILRSKIPSLFEGLSENNLDDVNFLTKHLSKNIFTLKKLLLNSKDLSSTERDELTKAFEGEVVTAGEDSQQTGGQNTTAEQAPINQGAGSSGGSIPSMGGGFSGPSGFSGRVMHPVNHAEETPGITASSASTVTAEAPATSTSSPATSTTTITSSNPHAPDSSSASSTSANTHTFSPPSSTASFASNTSNINLQPVQPEPAPHLPQKVGPVNFKTPSSFNTFSSRVASNVERNVKAGIERANPAMSKFINGGIRNLTNMVNFGSLGGTGGGSRSILGKLGRFGRGGGAGGKGLGKLAKSGRKKWLLALLIGMFGFGMIAGISGSSITPPGSTPGTGTFTGSSDISTCKFTRGAETPSAAQFQSNALLSYIQEAAQKSTIPSAVLAAFIRVESPSSSGMSDIQIANYPANCAVSPTGALGIMQIQPPGTTSLAGDPASCDTCIDAGAKLVGKTVTTLTRDDYCDPRTSIIVGSGWILKNMSYLGYGDGTKWDPAWTTDSKTITALVNTYYGDVLYPDVHTGPFNYADDVLTSIQNCQTTSSADVPPPPDGDLRLAIKDKFHITIDGSFDQNHLLWAWQILALSEKSAPKFLPLLWQKYSEINVGTTGGVGLRSGNSILFSTRPGSFFVAGGEPEYKQMLIHELAHIIHGTRGDDTYTQKLEEAVQKDKDFLTGYAQGSTAEETEVCKTADSKERTVQLDEDFAESVAYYIVDIAELNYDNDCPPKNSQNPFRTGKYPNHLNFMKQLLGGINF